MNIEQTICLNKLKKGKNIFLTGSAGTGKTFVLNEFIKFCEENNKQIGITATTGVSALLLGGSTIHSWSGIKLGDESLIYYLKKVKGNRALLQRWLSTKVLIIDEISMIDYKIMELLDQIAKKVRKSNKPFGGIQVILCGDFCQLGPVNVDKYLFETDIFNEIVSETIELKQVMRQSDPEFIKILKEIRMGYCSDKSEDLLEKQFNTELTSEYGILPTVLYSKKKDVYDLNIEKLEDLKRESNSSSTTFTTDYFYKTRSNRVKMECDEGKKWFKDASEQLELVVGAQVMLTYNLDVTNGLVNGTRGIISSLDNCIEMTLLDGRKIIICKIEKEIKGERKVIKSYIPLVLGYAITIHKSQGATIDYLKIDLGDDIFACGQTYTALSRAKSLEGLQLLSFNKDKIKTNIKVKNFYNTIKA